MAIKITVSCSMCSDTPDLEFYVDGPEELNPQVLKKAIEKHGWIVEFNGDNMDTYCTKKCAA